MQKSLLALTLGITLGTTMFPAAFAVEGPIEVPKVVTPTITPIVEEVVPVVEPPKTIVPIPPMKDMIPVIFPNSLIPTDSTPLMKMNFPNKGLTAEDMLSAANSKDERYKFTGVWIPFMEADSSQATKEPYKPIAFSEPVPPSDEKVNAADKSSTTNDSANSKAATTEKAAVEKPAVKKFGFVEYMEKHKFRLTELIQQLLCRRSSEAVFMPTKSAEYSKLAPDNLRVTDGAVLVRAGKIPVKVTTLVNGEMVVTHVKGGALALVSAFDKETIVLNLTDSRLSALMTDVPASGGRILPITIPPGQIAEIYPLDGKPVTNLVSRRVLVNERTREDMGLLISDSHFLRTMNRFRLTPALPKADLNRALKTAAALIYVRRFPRTAAAIKAPTPPAKLPPQEITDPNKTISGKNQTG